MLTKKATKTSSVIKGIDDNLNFELHGGTKLICAIMEIGKAKNLLLKVKEKGFELFDKEIPELYGITE